MLDVPITQAMLDMAYTKSYQMGCLHNSITHGVGNISGFLGEAMVASATGGYMANTYDYDLLIYNSKIDVKTKRTNAIPKPYYECSVADYNTKQLCDWYVFTRVSNCHTRGWILGCIRKKEFFEKAIFHKKGDLDLSNYFIFKADCYNIKIDQLYPLTEIFKYQLCYG